MNGLRWKWSQSLGRRLALVLGLTGAVVAAPLVACGGGTVRDDPPPRRSTAKAAPVAAAADPFDAFRGLTVELGSETRLQRDPVAVRGARVIVQLMKATYMIRERADGTEAKDATAHIRIQRGAEEVLLRVGDGGADRGLGVRVQVLEAGDEYLDSASDWVAFAVVRITAE